jgi:hypothetical protein
LFNDGWRLAGENHERRSRSDRRRVARSADRRRSTG